MAKGDKQDVARAKAAVSKQTKARMAKEAARAIPGVRLDKAAVRAIHPKPVGKAARNAFISKHNMLEREIKNAIKRGATSYPAGPLKDGAVKPGVSQAVKPSKVKNPRAGTVAKAQAANKMKAVGKKINSSPTSGFNRRGKK